LLAADILLGKNEAQLRGPMRKYLSQHPLDASQVIAVENGKRLWTVSQYGNLELVLDNMSPPGYISGGAIIRDGRVFTLTIVDNRMSLVETETPAEVIVFVQKYGDYSAFIADGGKVWKSTSHGTYYLVEEISGAVAFCKPYFVLCENGTIWNFKDLSSPFVAQSNVIAMEAGTNHVLCLLGDGTVTCIEYQKGSSFSLNEAEMKRIHLPFITAMAAGGEVSCFVDDQGDMWKAIHPYREPPRMVSQRALNPDPYICVNQGGDIIFQDADGTLWAISKLKFEANLVSEVSCIGAPVRQKSAKK